jgi:hypothetical protein
MLGLQVVGMSWTEVDTMEKNMTVQRNITFTFTMDNKVWVCKGEKLTQNIVPEEWGSYVLYSCEILDKP